MKIAIIGAGISGLTTAYYLNKLGHNNTIDIYEKEAFVGGKLKSVKLHGYMIEQGSDGFLPYKTSFYELVEELGISSQLVFADDEHRKKYLFDGSTLHAIPENASDFLSSELLGFWTKIRAFFELVVFRKSSTNDESLQRFGYRRIGKEITDKILDAYASTIYGSSAQKLSMKSAFPNIVELEKKYGGLILGMLKKKKNEPENAKSASSFQGGMDELLESLAEHSHSLHKNDEVVEVVKAGNGWKVLTKNGKNEEYDKVVVCTPSYIASRIIKNASDELTSKLKLIEYIPMASVALGYDEPVCETYKGAGFLTLKYSNTQILGILWDSCQFPQKAPSGKMLMRVILGGQRNPLLVSKEENEIIDTAISSVIQTMKIASRPAFTYVTRWHKAIPHYSMGHQALVDEIFDLSNAEMGLYLNSNAYKGLGISECITNSKACAKVVLGI